MIRKAEVRDVQEIKKLIDPYGRAGDMLPVSLSEIFDKLRSFFVYEDDGGKIIGTAALHVTWGNMAADPTINRSQDKEAGNLIENNKHYIKIDGGIAEIRSLCVDETFRNRGIGGELVRACLEDAKPLGVTRVFVLTYIPDFFQKMGFSHVDKGTLPHKVWSHCLKCVHFPNCEEVAMDIEV
jgi:amino-acid N-acetyltransferase